ncbi:MAG: YraN family protein [Deltaproteobacteria bacterium]|nr:YraN family protein [Deltaproteobacteria bacterium]
MLFSRKKKGDLGEDLAAKYLADRGFKVLLRNFRCKGGEVDLIATRSGELHFIEVKARSDAAFGGPVEAVDFRKQKRLTHAAHMYLAANQHWAAAPQCFSVVAIQGSRVELFPNAFPPAGNFY